VKKVFLEAVNHEQTLVFILLLIVGFNGATQRRMCDLAERY